MSSQPSALSTIHNPTAPLIEDNLDIETTALIVQLALEDLEEVFQRRKGKARAGSPPSDEEYAYQLQHDHYKHLLGVVEDAKLAKSISDALITDSAYLEAFFTAEAAATEDRRTAEILSQGGRLPAPNATQARLEDREFVMHPDPPMADRLIEGLGDALTRNLDPALTPVNLATAPKMATTFSRLVATAGPSVDRNKSVHCTICNEQIYHTNSLRTTCDHYYCRDCVKSLVEAFTRDESLFPLRCCQEPIPIENAIPFISLTLRDLLKAKDKEFRVLSKDRVYCVTPTCSTFLGSSKGITSWGIVCPQCATSTCPKCKQTSHEGEDCTVNAANVELRALARKEGWQTCPGCHTLVELSLGCYHMTCLCRTHFCYLCAVRWKECQCPQWEETRLMATAQQRVENELGARAVQNMAPELVAQRVERRAETLRYDHHCDRHKWKRRNGGGLCETCYHYLDEFLLICRHCSILACVRCSRNRL